jgi:hypothetical protein
MIYCENCGNKIANLIIERPGKVMGVLVDLNVTVGDTTYALGANKSYKFKLPNGIYNIKYKIWCRREKEVIVSIEDNKVCHIEFVYDALWGGFKVSKNSIL